MVDEFPRWIAQWAEDPYGGQWYPRVRDQILAHDPTCATLSSAWFPSRGGRSCDVTSCEVCDLYYFGDGGHGRGAGGNLWFTDLCECCSRRTDEELTAVLEVRRVEKEMRTEQAYREKKHGQ